jgi:hypothetical protein
MSGDYRHRGNLSGNWSRLRGVDLCALGVVLLVASLIGLHSHWDSAIKFNLGSTPVVIPATTVLSWLGSILVVVGLGRMLFLERR